MYPARKAPHPTAGCECSATVERMSDHTRTVSYLCRAQEDPEAAKKPKDRRDRATIDLKTVSRNGFWREGGYSFPV
eukprot:3737663-Pyramimonas_sp.AAC.1